MCLGCIQYDVLVFLQFISVNDFFLSLQYTWIVNSVLLDGVGIASSDIMSYQMCIVLFLKKKMGGGAGGACEPMQ